MDRGKREEIIKYLLDTDLIRICCECQLSKKKSDWELLEDLKQDVWEWILTYDEDKLENAYDNNHMNALITRYLINNIFSQHSPFWKRYHRCKDKEQRITQEELNIADE